MHRFFLFPASLFLFSGFLTSPLAEQEATSEFFEPRQVTIEGEAYSYRVYLPDDLDPAQRPPLVLFLHGAGERGSDGIQQTRVGIGPAIRSNPDRFPAVVVMPQCRRGSWWNAPRMEQMVTKILEESIQKFNVDPDRIYLTGLSMGGYGTFHFATKEPDRFAALAAVCGGVVPPRGSASPISHAADPYLDVAQRLRAVPVWLFHGALDRSVPVSESRNLYEAFQEVGAEVRYTEYPGVGHNSWDRAYSEPELMAWMLSQSRGD